ncbi:MAG: DUF2796 domain-containing protein [Candidatus Pelagadaptatus aseana]|uniref:DUF2796 domain-containing protein n=1 Tax=Candidatus Pelagadaptatus aseana TaxID=3120508 RepID=UPI0039B30B2B
MIRFVFVIASVLMIVPLVSAEGSHDHDNHNHHGHHSHSHNQHDHEDTYEQSAHLHGEAELTLALEGKVLEIALESPAANLVGFEHKAETESQLSAVAQAKAVLQSADSLFSISGGDCVVEHQDVDVSSLLDDDNHHDHKGHDHEDHANDDHSEIAAHYQYLCSDAAQVESVATALIKRFPGIERLKVIWLSEAGQGAVVLKGDSDRIQFK